MDLQVIQRWLKFQVFLCTSIKGPLPLMNEYIKSWKGFVLVLLWRTALRNGRKGKKTTWEYKSHQTFVWALQLKHVSAHYLRFCSASSLRKANGDFWKEDQTAESLDLATGITLRKLVRSTTLDIVDGMAQLVEVLSITPAQR